MRLSARLVAALGVNDVDLVILNDVPPGFARTIVTDGLRLVRPDPEGDHAFVRDVQLRAADLAPFLRRTAALKRDALARSLDRLGPVEEFLAVVTERLREDADPDR